VHMFPLDQTSCRRSSERAMSGIATGPSTTSSPQASAPRSTTPTSISRAEIEQFKTRMDTVLDEVNPTLDKLSTALREHNFANI